MKRIIPYLLCTALGACASPSQEPTEAKRAAAIIEEDNTQPSAEPTALLAKLPEVRYYVISEA